MRQLGQALLSAEAEIPTLQVLKRRLELPTEPSLQIIVTHLVDIAENPASLPVALASARALTAGGEGAWEGLGLLSGSSSNYPVPIMMSLTLRQHLSCSAHSTVRTTGRLSHDRSCQG